jgi:hypothetical protein
MKHMPAVMDRCYKMFKLRCYLPQQGLDTLARMRIMAQSQTLGAGCLLMSMEGVSSLLMGGGTTDG